MENYPQLKSDQNVLQLQEQLTTTENQIAFSRQAYNDAVLDLNNRIQDLSVEYHRRIISASNRPSISAAPPKIKRCRRSICRSERRARSGYTDAGFPVARQLRDGRGQLMSRRLLKRDQPAARRRCWCRFHDAVRRLGCGLDFVFGDLRIIDGRSRGLPAADGACARYRSRSVGALVFGGASLVLLSVHARPLQADSSKEQMVLDVVGEMALAARMPVPRAIHN